MTVEAAAESARKNILGIGLEGPVPDLLRLIEDEAQLRVFIVSLPRDGIDGAYQVVDGDHFVLINQDKGPERKRFTLAHEFGHHVLEHGAQLDKHISFGDKRQTEVDANNFAASLLTPRPAIDQWFARHGDPDIDLEVVVRLAFFFNISAFVVRYRLETVNRLGSLLSCNRLDEALDAKQHYAVASDLGLSRSEDSIRVQHRRGGYVPAVMQAKIAGLVRRDLLSEDAAKARLHLPEDAASELIQELLVPAAAAEGDEGE